MQNSQAFDVLASTLFMFLKIICYYYYYSLWPRRICLCIMFSSTRHNFQQSWAHLGGVLVAYEWLCGGNRVVRVGGGGIPVGFGGTRVSLVASRVRFVG